MIERKGKKMMDKARDNKNKGEKDLTRSKRAIENNSAPTRSKMIIRGGKDGGNFNKKGGKGKR